MNHFRLAAFLSLPFLKEKAQGRMAGFTLIELLIVILIISIVSGAILINISPNRNRQLESFTKDLTQTIVFAEEEALLQPAILMLAFEDHTVTFLRYETDKNDEKRQWIPLQTGNLGKHIIPDFIQVSVKLKNATEEQNQARIIISSNEDVTPFTIYIGQRGEKPRYAIIGRADGSITNQLLQ